MVLTAALYAPETTVLTVVLHALGTVVLTAVPYAPETVVLTVVQRFVRPHPPVLLLPTMAISIELLA